VACIVRARHALQPGVAVDNRDRCSGYRCAGRVVDLAEDGAGGFALRPAPHRKKQS